MAAAKRYFAARGLCALCLLGLAGSVSAERVYELIDARLELMDEVAAHKWERRLPVEDLSREAMVLEQAVADALALGFTPESSEAFFTAQIEAAKDIQRHWFRVWEQGGVPAPPPDLVSVVRPELMRLGAEILLAARAVSCPSREAFEEAVAVEGLGVEHRAAVFEALRGLRRFGNRLEQILSTGVLRVGTTGDYLPFSHQDDAGEPPSGIDIDLALHLADTLDVEVEFVATSWPTLLADLDAGRYDIAMSGVSRTLDRQKHGYLSSPYYVGGKTPIARCQRAERFGSLESIDRPGVRVIVNPGGTNEAFVDTRLQRARKVSHPDNRTIFAALMAGEADVMITDRVEVELQTRRHPELCATMPGTLSYQEKAYLMPQDGPWKEFVDTWLALAISDGTVAGAFRRHGVEPRTAAR